MHVPGATQLVSAIEERRARKSLPFAQDLALRGAGDDAGPAAYDAPARALTPWACSNHMGASWARRRASTLPDHGAIEGEMMTRCGTGVVLLLGLVVLGQHGCGGDDDTPAAAARCTGEGCACAENNECTCTGGDACKTTCVRCSLTCDQGAKCNAEASAAVELVCDDSSECKGNGGDGSVLTCRGSSSCDLKGGADSVATCADSSDCKINLGPLSMVTCTDSARCDIKCDDGQCEVACEPSTDCALNCGEADGGKPGTECPDGRLICGTDC